MFLFWTDCASSPCLNDGRCVVETTGYRCACAEQYGGIHCEHCKYIYKQENEMIDKQSINT